MGSQGTARERSFFSKVLETLVLIATWVSLVSWAIALINNAVKILDISNAKLNDVFPIPS